MKEQGNMNIIYFTGVMNFEASFETKLKVFNNKNKVLLAADRKREISVLHSPKNFGGTYYRAEQGGMHHQNEAESDRCHSQQTCRP